MIIKATKDDLPRLTAGGEMMKGDLTDMDIREVIQEEAFLQIIVGISQTEDLIDEIIKDRQTLLIVVREEVKNDIREDIE